MLYAFDPCATIALPDIPPQPPPAYYVLYPQQQQPLPVPQPAARNEPAPAKKETESLIKRFRLESRLKEDIPIEPENAGGKAVWEPTPIAREKSLQERKAQMILAARRYLSRPSWLCLDADHNFV